MKKLWLKSMVLCAIAVGMSSCCEDCGNDDDFCDGPPRKAISKEAEPYFNFPIGSYWVYQDSLFHEAKDTFRLITNKREFDDGTQNAYYVDCPQNGLSDNWNISYQTTKKLCRLDTMRFRFLSQNIGDTLLYKLGSPNAIRHNHSFTQVGHKKYDCVKETWYLNQNGTYQVYRAKDIGIVKIVDEFNHKTWELDTFYIAK